MRRLGGFKFNIIRNGKSLFFCILNLTGGLDKGREGNTKIYKKKVNFFFIVYF